MSLAEFVKISRKRRGLTKAELASIAGISPSFLGRIENGRYKTTSIETLTKLARALQVPFDEIKTIVIKRQNAPVIYSVKPKTPAEIIRDLTSSLPELVPVYTKLGDKKVAEYAFLPQPVPKYRGRKMELLGIKSNIKYKDLVRPGDILVVASEITPEKGDLCIKNNKGVISLVESDGMPLITIIRYVKMLE